MLNFLRSHLHPLGGRIIFWNFVFLAVIKVVLPYTFFQSATLLGSLPVFDSRDIIKITNEARTANHLLSLQINSRLDLAASEKLNDMASNEYFAHVSPEGVNPWYWIKNAQYQYSVAGENLAIGFFTAQDTVQAWLNSPSHRANIMNGKYRDIGVAVQGVEINGREGILVVQMFGLPAGPPAGRAGQIGSPSTQTAVAVKTPVPKPRPIETLPRQVTVAASQDVSSDRSIEPVREPTLVEFQDMEEATRVSSLLNNIFTGYVMVIALISIVAFLLFERSRLMALKMAFNTALLVFAISVPAAQIYFTGLIF